MPRTILVTTEVTVYTAQEISDLACAGDPRATRAYDVLYEVALDTLVNHETVVAFHDGALFTIDGEPIQRATTEAR